VICALDKNIKYIKQIIIEIFQKKTKKKKPSKMSFSVTDLPALEKALTASTYLSGADKPSQVDADIINQLRGRADYILKMV
jgi:hypothetical protein